MSNKTKEDFKYAENISRLEDIVRQLENGDVDIDEALVLHKEGQKIADALTAYLEHIGSEIRVQAEGK